MNHVCSERQYAMPIKPTADFSHFEALDIRVGRVVKVEDAATRKPTYRMTIDFGPEIGTKVSCGAYRNYPKDALLGQQVLAVVNFAPRQMGPEVSEVLVLGVPNAGGETIYVTPQQAVGLGVALF
jgi:tRNA-binding protein